MKKNIYISADPKDLTFVNKLESKLSKNNYNVIISNSSKKVVYWNSFTHFCCIVSSGIEQSDHIKSDLLNALENKLNIAFIVIDDYPLDHIYEIYGVDNKSCKSFNFSDKTDFEKACKSIIASFRDVEDSTCFGLIAVQIEGSIFNKMLSPGWYFFNDLYILTEDNRLTINPNSIYKGFYGSDIMISAIVGKNGSGKSAILELIYRMLYNWAILKMNKAHDHSLMISGIVAKLYFCNRGKLYYLYCSSDNVADIYEYNTGVKNEEQYFPFFNLVLNFAIGALNPYDFESEIRNHSRFNWLIDSYNKSENPLFPIRFSPEKRQSSFTTAPYQRNVERAKQAAFFLNSSTWLSENNYGYEVLEGYELDHINFVFDEDVYETIENKYFKKASSPKALPKDCAGYHIYSFFSDFFKKKGILLEKFENPFCWFLIYEASISLKQHQGIRGPGISKIWSLNNFTVSNKNNKQDFAWIKEWLNTIVFKRFYNHWGLKQIVLYILSENYTKKAFSWDDYEKAIFNNMNNGIIDISNEYQHNLLACMPPMIFKPIVALRKKKTKEVIPIWQLSTGERQAIANYQAISYHLQYLQKFHGTNYTNVNIIFDEVELSYHPDYQRKFIFDLLRFIKTAKLDDKYKFNIILVTHSPFILSDIPSSNILFMKEGKAESSQNRRSLGANIYDMLSDGFFMESNIGEYVQSQLDKMIDTFHMMTTDNKDEYSKALKIFNDEQQLFEYLSNHIAEDYLQKTLKHMYTFMVNQNRKANADESNRISEGS